MIRRYAPAAALLAAALLLPAGAAAQHARKGATTYGGIDALAMDGPLVAYDAGANINQRCNKVFAWNVATGAHKKVSGKHTCGADSTSTGAGVAQLAVGGKRIGWIVNQGGNSESYDDLYVSSWSKPKEQHLAHAYRQGDVSVPSTLTGTWIGGLVGSGSVLDVTRWTTDNAGNVTKGKLQRISRGLTTVASGTDTVQAVATGAGRVAVLRSNRDIAIYSSGGTVVRTVSPGKAKAVALSATTLAVLTGTNMLELYRISTGTLTHSWQLKHIRAAAWVRAGLAIHKGIAVYSGRNRVYAVRLATGKTVRIANAPRSINALLAMSAPGAVYAYSTFNPKTPKIAGHVVFVPMPKIRAALG